MIWATVIGIGAGGIIMISSLIEQKNVFRGMLAGLICGIVGVVASDTPDSWDEGYVIAFIFVVCALYVSKNYPRPTK